MKPRGVGAAAPFGTAAGMGSMVPLALASGGELVCDKLPGAGERKVAALRLLARGRR